MRLTVTLLNITALLPLAFVSSFGWMLLLIGVSDAGNTPKAYLMGATSFVVPWVAWLLSLMASRWLLRRGWAWVAVLMAAAPLAVEVVLFRHFR